MGCFSTSLEDVVNKSDDARIQVENLQKGLEKSDATFKKIFFDKRDEFFRNNGLDDVTYKEVATNIKVEFASEFSLDKVIPVVQAAINAAVSTYAAGKAIGANTQKAFSDLVVAIGECAKFSSSATGSMSFSTNRLSPGLFVSLYAASTNVEDKNMFGKKAVTATVYYYQLSTSTKDITADMMRELALMYADGVINLNRKLLDLANQAAAGTITFDTYNEMKQTIQKLINDLKPSLATYKNANEKYSQMVTRMVETEIKSAHFKLFKDLHLKDSIHGESSMNLTQVFKEYNATLESFK